MRSCLLLVTLACKGPGPTTTPTDSDPPTDTAVPYFGDNEGGISLVRRYVAGQLDEARLMGVFAHERQGFVNLAQCALDETAPCIRDVPDLGNQLPFQPVDRFIPETTYFQYVGLRIRLGDHFGFYEVGEDLSYYDADITDEPQGSGPATLRIPGVEWGPFELDDAVVVPRSFDLVTPSSEESVIAFSNDRAFPLVWTPDPTPGADVVITLRNEDPEQQAWIWRVPDSGAYDLDLDRLDIDDDQHLILTIGRWTLDAFDVNGNDLIVHVASESVIDLDYRDVGLREPVEVRASCEVQPPRVPLGRFYGDLSEQFDDFRAVACLQSFDAADGRDGLFTLTVPPRTRTDLEYRQLDANASMYLLDSCATDALCVLGADRNSGQQPEQLTVFNPSATEPLEYTLVLDAAESLTGGLFFLDHERTPIPEPAWANTCIEALGSPELAPGPYYGPDLSLLTNEFEAGFTGCTGTSLPGPDGLLPITLPAGATLEVTMAMEDGADPALLLLSDCSDLASCLTGSDQPGDLEQLVYANPNGTDVQVYLMLDTRGGSGPYTMNVSVN